MVAAYVVIIVNALKNVVMLRNATCFISTPKFYAVVSPGNSRIAKMFLLTDSS